jgi:formylglycine-generating enzyme required for sulfatase activity
VERDSLLKGVFQFARRPKACDRDDAIEELLDVALHPRQRWIEAPKADRRLAAPQLADTPVTVASHARFLEAVTQGDVEDVLWRHAPKGASSSTLIDDEIEWASQLGSPAVPVTSVTWFEAVAHARWLTERGRQAGLLQPDEVIRLLTRFEWETLARRFADGHRYPWGEDELNDGSEARVNWLLDCGLDWPSVPGVFRPYGLPGLYDFGATIRSWVILDRDGDAVWPPRLEEGELPRVIGGSWACPENHFAAASPGMPLSPNSRDNCVGYRLVRVRGDRAFAERT